MEGENASFILDFIKKKSTKAKPQKQLKVKPPHCQKIICSSPD